MIVIDTDVLAIHHIFTWDRRWKINEKFLLEVVEPATTIHNLLELVSLIIRAFRRSELAIKIFKYYISSDKWKVLFPPEFTGWEYFTDEIFNYISRGMSYADSLIAWTIEEQSEVEAFITWNLNDFRNKMKVMVYSPEEWLMRMGHK